MGARWYDDYLGRFVSPDTIVPDPGNPQDLNRYSYVRNNPVGYRDPSGHARIPPPDTVIDISGWSKVAVAALKVACFVGGSQTSVDGDLLTIHRDDPTAFAMSIVGLSGPISAPAYGAVGSLTNLADDWADDAAREIFDDLIANDNRLRIDATTARRLQSQEVWKNMMARANEQAGQWEMAVIELADESYELVLLGPRDMIPEEAFRTWFHIEPGISAAPSGMDNSLHLAYTYEQAEMANGYVQTYFSTMMDEAGNTWFYWLDDKAKGLLGWE
jgi:hypothetical protein